MSWSRPVHRLHYSLEIFHLFPIKAHAVILSILDHPFNILEAGFSFFFNFFEFLSCDLIFMLHPLFEFDFVFVEILHSFITFDYSSFQKINIRNGRIQLHLCFILSSRLAEVVTQICS